MKPVLIVTDNQALIALCQSLLSATATSLRSVGSSRKAIQAEIAEHPPTVVVFDRAVPIKRGDDPLDAIIAALSYENVIIINALPPESATDVQTSDERAEYAVKLEIVARDVLARVKHTYALTTAPVA